MFIQRYLFLYLHKIIIKQIRLFKVCQFVTQSYSQAFVPFTFPLYFCMLFSCFLTLLSQSYLPIFNLSPYFSFHSSCSFQSCFCLYNTQPKCKASHLTYVGSISLRTRIVDTLRVQKKNMMSFLLPTDQKHVTRILNDNAEKEKGFLRNCYLRKILSK